jgi:hypothetical protein
MHLKRRSGLSSEEPGSYLVVVEFEYSDNGDLFYLTTIVSRK